MRFRLYVHLVWTTRNRDRAIDAWRARFLSHYLQRVARQERCHILALGIVRTHVHALLAIHPLTVLPRLIQRMKGGSATVSNREGHGLQVLRWAKGYNLETVSPKSLAHARAYILNQAGHQPDEAILGWEGFRREEHDPAEDEDPRAREAASGSGVDRPLSAARAEQRLSAAGGHVTPG
jgi:REP element-mobilizing transposase RayT